MYRRRHAWNLERMPIPDRKLEYIAPARLREVWPKIRLGLEKMEGNEGWLVEDVYHSLMLNESTLHLVIVDDLYCGFVILKPMEGFKKRLHIWHLYNESKFDVMAIFKPTLEIYARNINATALTFSSPRKGWQKVAGRYGFSPTTYEAKIWTQAAAADNKQQPQA